MSVTKYRHHIDTIKGEDYVLHKDYTELMNNLEKEIDRLNIIISELEKWCNECIGYHIIARQNGDTTIEDTFFKIVLDKLKELKEEGK